MPKQTAAEAFEQFQSNGGVYGGGYNNPGNFTSEEEWANFKEMVPKEAKKAFRAKVAGRENAAIEGMMQGKTREEMGILDKKEEGQSLYRRLGAGLGTGIDINKAYNWDAGTATEVGTSDLSKRGIEQRGITGVEQQRHADLQRAGSPEALWAGYRGNQISGLLSSGAIAQDENGYYNPGPGGGDRYGANLEGYNMGRGVMGNGTNLGGPNMGGGGAPQTGYTPGSYTPPAMPQAQPTAPQAAPQTPSTPVVTPPAATPSYSYNPASSTGNTGFTGGGLGGASAPNNLSSLTSGKAGKAPDYGAIYAEAGYNNPAMPPGPLPDGGTPLVVHPGENVNVVPAGQNPAAGAAGGAASPFGGGAPGNTFGGMIRENAPGSSALPANNPFGTNPVPLPTGNGLVPGSSGGSTGSGGSTLPPLGGVNLPGQVPLGNSNPLQAPGGSGLAGQAGYDNSGQRFNYNRAVGEYGGAQALERGQLGIYGDILGFNPMTGERLNEADSNNRSFAFLAPQAQRTAGDADALVKRLEATLPPGGERDAAIASALRGAQADISGGRQALMQQALTGVGELAQSKKGFDPQYTGANQSLLDSYGNLRGQDLSTMLGSRGQDISGLIGARGQDSAYNLGQEQLSQQQMENMWSTYLQGRGQDMDYYGNIRGQDLGAVDARANRSNSNQQQNGANRTAQFAAIAGGIALVA